jgi:hypothetical protein
VPPELAKNISVNIEIKKKMMNPLIAGAYSPE